MRIVAFVNRNSGPSYHRIIAPLLMMPDMDVCVTNDLDLRHFEKGCDILMYNRVLPDKHMPKIKELQKEMGFKICVDIDDYWELDESHVLYDEYQTDGFAKRQVEHLRNADFVFTTHSRLADEIKPINSRVHVLPNAIPKSGQFDIETEPYYLVRLFWQGSRTHGKDISIIQTPIEALGGISFKIKMVMAGYEQGRPEWHNMALTFTAGLKHQYRLIPGQPVTSYYEAYKNADICLVPLVNSKFNGMKSNLKVLEAANLGLPVICSQVNPYLDLPVMYARCSADWVKHIKRLVKSRRARRDEGQRIKEHCDAHFNFDKINKKRKQIFEYEARACTVS